MNKHVDAALASEAKHAAAQIPINYEKANAMFKRQKAALSRAVKSGDTDKVVAACRAAVREWDQPDIRWPDDWSDWQRALNDQLARDPDYGLVFGLDLRELAYAD